MQKHEIFIMIYRFVRMHALCADGLKSRWFSSKNVRMLPCIRVRTLWCIIGRACAEMSTKEQKEKDGGGDVGVVLHQGQ